MGTEQYLNRFLKKCNNTKKNKLKQKQKMESAFMFTLGTN